MSSESIDKSPPQTRSEQQDALTQAIRRAVKGIRFGSVEIVVHDGRVVQIERREKVRLETAGISAAR